MTTNETIPALLPCPFCGDTMQVRYGTIRHQEPGDCIVGSLAFDASWADRVNRRATRPSSEALQQAREEAFVQGFMASAEGFNGEYPLDYDEEMFRETDTFKSFATRAAKRQEAGE